MNNKTKELLLYLIDRRGGLSVTSLMKLCYLADLMNVKENGKQISDFSYRRYYFGPFDKVIYEALEELSKEGVVSGNLIYTHEGKEFLEYRINEDGEGDFELEAVSENERAVVDSLLEKVKGYGARIITEIAYKTAPKRITKSRRPQQSQQ
jgi:DNA-binding PadR family transcriptional regulator